MATYKYEAKCNDCDNHFYKHEDKWTLDWYTKCPKCGSWNCTPTGNKMDTI
jgi:Zn finger protein HypA/HybF involved in hydrogenase expression